jgi:hypothetical protein
VCSSDLNVTFSEDPVPNYHRLKGQVTSGNLLSPVFGGLTSNTEFEFLTGNAMRFAAYGQIPYYKGDVYVDRDEGRALPSMFGKNGYRTVGLHTYTGAFFDRYLHYPKLGFDEFIAAEDIVNPLIKGEFHGQEIIADEYFCGKLLGIIDGNALENPDQPLFIFGITMQNHTPYLADKYAETLIKADSGGILTYEDTAALEAYLEGVHDADAVLGRLYDYVQGTERPTIVVYFGDHLPFITQITGVYAELGYVEALALEDLTIEERYKMYTTPYLAFANYTDLPGTWGDISPYYLGALTADAAGIRKNLYSEFLIQAFESFQAMNEELYIADGEISAELPESSAALTMFEAFQYDKLFGEGYMNRVLAALQ